MTSAGCGSLQNLSGALGRWMLKFMVCGWERAIRESPLLLTIMVGSPWYRSRHPLSTKTRDVRQVPKKNGDLGRFYSAFQKLNTPQTTKTAQIGSFIERVRLPLDCILLKRCGGTTFIDTAQVFWVSLQRAPVLCWPMPWPLQFCPLLLCFPSISDGCVEMWPSESINMRMRLLHVFHFQPRHWGNPVGTLLCSKQTMWDFHDMTTSPCNLM